MDFLTAAITEAASAAPMPFTANVEPVLGRVLHVDGDYCAYYCAGNDETDAGTARRNLLDRLQQAKHAAGATKIIVHLSDGMCTKGERYLIATVQPYQDQRNASRKPDNWACLREFMEGYEGTEFEKKIWLNREADDGIAFVCQTAAEQFGKLHAVLTADKDMRMFCGIHIVWKTYQQVVVPLGTFELVGGDGKLYGHKWFWTQMLQGDPADYIPGIPRVGEKTAALELRTVKDNVEAMRVVAGMYERKYGDEWADRFVEQAALLWMRTDRTAAIDNFLSLGCYGDEITQAAARMVQRVTEARAQLEALAA